MFDYTYSISDRVQIGDLTLHVSFWKGFTEKLWGTRLKFSTAFHPETDADSRILHSNIRGYFLRSWCFRMGQKVGERILEGPKMIEVTKMKVPSPWKSLRKLILFREELTRQASQALEFQP
ncbi:hypothetical protein Tco_1146359 [Tanacetum coccineum]|uniref:Uncharacterized protein n=1 Tax=Tanacetum coccineum TaxID=301880 RepID=A0ABQ5F4V6_9ASTR